jgi:hypothetical protein
VGGGGAGQIPGSVPGGLGCNGSDRGRGCSGGGGNGGMGRAAARGKGKRPAFIGALTLGDDG